jgi:hypothetical protein
MAGLHLQAQYYGMDSIHLSTANVNALAHVPAGSGKFGLLIEAPDQAYNLSASACGLCKLFDFGTPKLIKNGGSVLISGHDTIITVTYQPANYGDAAFAIRDIITDCISKYATKIDTTKDGNGFYTHIGIAAAEHGADAVFNGLCWQSGISFGSDPRPVLNKIRKIFVSRPNDIYNIGSFTGASYSQAGGRIIKFFRKASDYTIEQGLRDSLAAHSPSAYLKLKQYSLTNQQLYDTMFSNLSPDSSTNLRMNLMDVPGTPPPPNYPARPVDYFDFSLYAARDDNNPDFYFDGFGHIDPKNDITTYGGSKWDSLRGNTLELYDDYFHTNYPGHGGVPVMFDMTGQRDPTDTSIKFVFTDIYSLNINFDDGNTAYFYNGDKILRQPPENRLEYLSRPDSFLVPFATITTTNGIKSWLNISCSDSMRFVYMVVGINSAPGIYGTGSNGKSFQSGELVFYGRYTDTTGLNALKRTPYTGPLPSNRTQNMTFDKRNGTCMQQGVDTLDLTEAGDGVFRYFWDVKYNDNQKIKSYTAFQTKSFPDIGQPQFDYHKRKGQIAYLSMQGPSAYIDSVSNAAGHYTQLNVDSLTADPRRWQSYHRQGDLMFNMTAHYGRNNISTGITKITGDALPNGLGTFNYIQNHNENDGHGANALAVYADMTASWDGDEGRLGSYMGVRAADTTMKMISCASVENDLNLIKCVWLCSKWCRYDGIVPCSGFAFHHYRSNRDTFPGITYYWPKANDMHSAPAEEVDILTRYGNFIRNSVGYVGLKEFYIDETGQANYGTAIKSNNDVGVVGNYSTPSTTGWPDSLVVKAIDMSKDALISCFISGLTWRCEFSLENYLSLTNNNNIAKDAVMGRAAGRQASQPYSLTVKYPLWYYMSFLFRELRGWYADSIISNGGRLGKWQLLFRKFGQSDSCKLFTFKGGHYGDTLAAQTLTFPGHEGPVSALTPSSTTLAGARSNIPVFAHQAARSIYEYFQVYAYRQHRTIAVRGKRIRISH